MRKHNEGYSLVLVLVVLVVICLVATFILSFSLSNLKNQQASVERMQDRYAAAGEIEKIVAQVEDMIDTTAPVQTITLDGDVNCEELTIPYTVSGGTVRIDVTLRLVADEIKEAEGENNYTITNWTGVEYVSYQISTVEEVAE